ncbi:MAG TPA: biotin/lipoyl-containing protein [Planctomycetota bacterium]|jgi:pyruvate/2-oxoglutarate dehydrogenase complex dihydrolipoamide acyltransferase (E2) component
MTNVEMPKANENMTEATLERWLVKEGQPVAKDQGLCEIITDKAKFEMPSPAAGQILKILGPERAVLPVGYVMCVVGAPGEVPPADLAARNDALLASHRAAATAIPSVGGAATTQSAGSNVSGGAVRATPAARRLAKEQGVDLADVVRVLNLTAPVNEKDIKAYLERKK